MRITIHNARTSNLGAFTPKHNDRNFDFSNAEHIDAERVNLNRYWNWTGNKNMTFEAAEAAFYEKHIKQHLEAQNARYMANRHAERVKTMDEYRKNRQSCPEEVILQIGKFGDTVPANEAARIIQDHINWEQKTFPGLRVLNVAIHLDEQGAPHVHERRVWLYKDKQGNLAIGQNKSLEQMGIEPPNPNKPIGRYNNRKQTFSRLCREHFTQLCKERGLDIEEEPRERSKSGLALTEYKARQAEERASMAEQRTNRTEQERNIARDELERIKRAKTYAKKRAEMAQEQAKEQELRNMSLRVEESQIRENMEREQVVSRQLSEMNEKARHRLIETQKHLKALQPYLSKAEQRAFKEQQELMRKYDDEYER